MQYSTMRNRLKFKAIVGMAECRAAYASARKSFPDVVFAEVFGDELTIIRSGEKFDRMSRDFVSGQRMLLTALDERENKLYVIDVSPRSTKGE